jgi:hypothetical protein
MDFVIRAIVGCHAVGAGREFNLYSMNTGSYVYHMTGNHGQYNEHFNNNFFSVERKFSADSKYSALVGTMKNSFDDRCLTLGVRRDWLKNDTGWLLKGVYAYTGNFSLTLSATAATQAPTAPPKKSPASVFRPIFIMVCNTTLPIISASRAGLLYRRSS